MRVGIGGILHESNTFCPSHTPLEAFEIEREDLLLKTWSGAHHEVSGFIEGASKYGYEIYPTIMAQAVPSGRVTADAFESLCSETVRLLASSKPLDGVLLALHGAMVSEKFADADGEIARRLREALGPSVPIVVTLDYHANVSEQIVNETTALVIYRTYPHVDQRERGLRAAEILVNTIRKKTRPTQSLSKPPMLLNIIHQNTSVDPMQAIIAMTRDIERNPRVLVANVAGGFQFADVFQMGPSVVVVTDNDADLAEREARKLSDALWNLRTQMKFDLPSASEAVRRAKGSEQTPVVLVDLGDNIGGGSAGDGTTILGELLLQNVKEWLVVLADPEAVQACNRAGVNASVSLQVGGKRDRLHGEPVKIHGRVKCLHDGRYEETEARHGGKRFHDQGLTAVLEITGARFEVPSMLVLTSNREPPFSLNQILSVGIQPQKQRVLVVKAAIAHKAAYEPIAGQSIQVDTPGLTSVNPARFTYENIRRPIWMLEPKPRIR